MATIGNKELLTKYPITTGLTAGTNRQHGVDHVLKPTIKSLVSAKAKVGFSDG